MIHSTLPSKVIFEAEGTELKMAAMKKPQSQAIEGNLQVLQAQTGNKFSLTIFNSNIKRSCVIEPGHGSPSVKKRDNRFTIQIKRQNDVYIFTGKLSTADSLQKLEALLSELPLKQSWKSKEGLMIERENSLTKTVKKPNVSNNGSFNSSFNSSFKENASKINRTPKRLAMKERNPDRKPLNILSDANDKSATPPLHNSTGGFYGKQTPGLMPPPVAKQFWRSLGNSIFPKFARNRFKISPKKNDDEITDFKIENDKGDEVVGFKNLGNTCYMNAILQCLLNIPNFYQELQNPNNLSLVEDTSLYKRLSQLGTVKHNLEGIESQGRHLQLVKESISSAAKRFSGYAQHDAHEFLCQCLDQLKEDLATEIPKRKQEMMLDDDELEKIFTCPIRENFETKVVHSIKCCSCEEEVIKEEEYNDFSLVIPSVDENFNPDRISMDQLLDMYFANENIEYTCEKCKNAYSLLSHQMKKIPRILILHLKRYDMDDTKKSDSVNIPKLLEISKPVSTDVETPTNFDLDRSLWKSVNLKSGTKRKSEGLSNETSLNKARKMKNEFSLVNEKSAAEMLAISARESRKEGDQISFDRFTKLKGPRKSLKFDGSDDEVVFEEAANSTAIDEDAELKRVMELSMKEYKTQQQKEMQRYTTQQDEATMSNVNLDSSLSCLPSSQNEKNLGAQTYNLVGIVNHHGMDTSSGHYTCDCYDFKSKKWRSFNDSSVEEISEEQFLRNNSSAYILFYMHNSCFTGIEAKF